MRLHLRSLTLAAALIVPAAVFAACGDFSRRRGACRGQSPRPPVPRRPLQRGLTLASKLDQLVDAGSPGVIALVNDGHGVRLSAAGVADTRTGRALRPTDRFRAGSNTKSFVATVALQLVAEGKL